MGESRKYAQPSPGLRSQNSLLFFHARCRASAFLHHAAKGIGVAALLTGMLDLRRRLLAHPFRNEFGFAAGALVTGHRFRLRDARALHGFFYNRDPSVFALGTRHHDRVARLKLLDIGVRFEAVEFHQFCRALLLRQCLAGQPRYGCERKHETGPHQTITRSVHLHYVPFCLNG